MISAALVRPPPRLSGAGLGQTTVAPAGAHTGPGPSRRCGVTAPPTSASGVSGSPHEHRHRRDTDSWSVGVTWTMRRFTGPANIRTRSDHLRAQRRPVPTAAHTGPAVAPLYRGATSLR